MKKNLIFLEDGNFINSVDLLEVVRQIYGEEGCETYGVSVNNECLEAVGVFDNLIQVIDEEINEYDAMNVKDIIKELHKHYDFNSILIPATQFGRMLAPRLAMSLQVGLVADVTAINYRDGILEMVRPAFSGKIMAGIIQQGEGPIMMSVRENVFSYKSGAVKDTKIISYHPEKKYKSAIKLIEKNEKAQSYDIRQSEVLISGGGGTMRNFTKLQELAEVLQGQVSASRKIIDKGIAPRSIQVGQSGKTVNPKLYMALGISGAIQHVEGLKNVEHIISVNTNRNAPICSLSDIVVEGDVFEFIDKLKKRIEVDK